MSTKNIINFNCKKCNYTSHRKHNLIRHMISKHQDETDVDIPDNTNEDISNNINVCITTNEENSTLESDNKVHVNITSIENITNTIKEENHKCSKCKKYFYTNKSLLKHNKECKETLEVKSGTIHEPINGTFTELNLKKLRKIPVNIDISNEEDSDSFISESSYEPVYNTKTPVIEGIDIKLFTIKEKLFDIIQFIIFEKNKNVKDENKDTQKIYRNIYKSISKCMTNILLDEQELIYNSGSESPRNYTLTSSKRRGSWV